MPPKKTKKKNASSDKYWFDQEAAQLAVDFCSIYLTHVKGEWAGKQLELDDWEADFLRNLFGWKKRSDNTRKYRKALLFIARKNGKTTLGAAIGLYLLLADKEPGAEVYSVAADRDQAAIMFDIARSMVENNPKLESRCEVYRRSIVVPATGSAYHVLSADAPSKHGKNSHGVLFDELHAQPNRDLYDVMKTSMGSRRQPLFLMFTTAGFDRQSVCYEEYEYAKKVRDGIIIDETYLPIIYEMDEAADWRDENAWRDANPGLGKSPKIEFLREECNRAQESPAYQNTFRRLYGNQWTEQAERAIDMALWDTCPPMVDLDELNNHTCYGGLDLASTMDICALVLCFPDDDGGFTWLPRFWIPEEAAEKRSRKDLLQYEDWVRQGLMIATPGNVTDYDFIREDIKELADIYHIKEIAYDRWNASQLVTQLMGDGALMVPFGQGFQSMAAPTKELIKLVASGMLRHGGHPVLRWMANNLAVRQDPAGNIKPDKSKSSEKIDGIVAGVMALGRAMVQQSGGSIYEQTDGVGIWT